MMTDQQDQPRDQIQSAADAASMDDFETDKPQRDARANAFAVDRLSQAFETSARRWELIVYPSLFAFIILAA